MQSEGLRRGALRGVTGASKDHMLANPKQGKPRSRDGESLQNPDA